MAGGSVSGVGAAGGANQAQASGCGSAGDAGQKFSGCVQKASKCGGTQDGGNGIEDLLKQLMAALQQVTGAQQSGAASASGVG